MKNLRVARRYAAALMKAAEDAGTVQAVAADLDVIAMFLRDSREFRLLSESPIISEARKSAIFRDLFGSRLSADTLLFLLLLIRKGRESDISEIIVQFRVLMNDRMGIVDVQVTSAVALAGEQEKALQHQLENYTRKKVRMSIGVDTMLRGGLVIQIGDTVLNASVQHQLKRLRERFASGTGA
jgi:F-type H+-transporting ATPase subunit delta